VFTTLDDPGDHSNDDYHTSVRIYHITQKPLTDDTEHYHGVVHVFTGHWKVWWEEEKHGRKSGEGQANNVANWAEDGSKSQSGRRE
jgi:hypothetical protein